MRWMHAVPCICFLSPRGSSIRGFLDHRTEMEIEAPEAPDFVRVKVLASDNEISAHYQEADELGNGMFGRTVRVADVQNPPREFAMKIQPKISHWFPEADPSEEVLRLYKELLIMNRILPKHPNIIQIKDILISPTKIYIVQEICGGRTMDDFFYQANNESGRRAFAQLVEAVYTCHEHGVSHCDIKADNILFLDRGYMQLKLIDFGCSIYRPDWAVKRHNEFDHRKWFRPEEIEPRNLNSMFIDVQSLGKMLHCILAGKFVPYLFSNSFEETITRYRPRTEMFDAAALDLLMKMGPAPFGPSEIQDFPTTHQIRQHPWLTGAPFQPAPPVNLNEEFTLLQEDLTGIKRLLKEWMLPPLTIIPDDDAFAEHYEIVGELIRGNDVTKAFEINKGMRLSQNKAFKITYGRMPGMEEILYGGYESKIPTLVYMEMLITLRILPLTPHLASVREVFLNPLYVGVVRELYAKNSLEDFFPNATDRTARQLFKQIADTVRVMHRHGVVHMDLHPHHIVFTDEYFSHSKIISFSRAVYVQQMAELTYENFRPELYISPELSQMLPHANVQVDISALGRILHAMMAKTWESDPELCCELPILAEDFDPAARDLLSKIGPQPHGPAEANRNTTIDQICDHPWVTLQWAP